MTSNQEIEASDSKRPKLSCEGEQDMDQRSAAGPSNVDTSPKLFKLNLDCFDEIFVYLSLRDLLGLAVSCKTMQKVVGQFLKQKYPDIVLRVAYNEKPTAYELYADGECVTCITLDGVGLSITANPALYPNVFGSIHKMVLITALDGNVADAINEYIHHLEVVDISCDVNVNLYDRLLKWCKNLKTLYISKQYLCPEQIPKQDSWMCQKYPKLEHFEFNSRDLKYELMTFLEKNPNLRTLGMRADDLWMYRNKIAKSPLRLDVFKIMVTMVNDSFLALCPLLNKLHEQQFYERLHIEVSTSQDRLPPTVYAALNSLSGLERLDVQHMMDLNPLVRRDRGVAFDSKFMNVEQLPIRNAKGGTILTVFKELPKLEMFPFDGYGAKNIITRQLEILDEIRSALVNSD